MKSSLNLTSIVTAIGDFARRFHTIIFFLIISCGLFVAIVMLLSIINLSSSTAGSSTQAISQSFDEATIQQLEQNSTEHISPGARSSPFVE